MAINVAGFVALLTDCGNVLFKPGNVRFPAANKLDGITGHRGVCTLVTVRKPAIVKRIDNVRDNVTESAGIAFVDNGEKFAAPKNGIKAEFEGKNGKNRVVIAYKQEFWATVMDSVTISADADPFKPVKFSKPKIGD